MTTDVGSYAGMFCDLPDAVRMEFRRRIEAAGGEVQGYNGECVTVAVPNPPRPFRDDMEHAGLVEAGGSWYFPLGSDNPPDSLRHDGRYPGSKGFWLIMTLRPHRGLRPCPACGMPWLPRLTAPRVPLDVRCACCQV